ncbi:MAG: DNA primase [Candidatus Woykebacteria bacterium RBG_19FT_COMBO_43_10]|uniref:DNA primase n=1 Tax=Candidatus Woykebacteria bacterium RBG_19FT_COMBO_43_10 TaxID=1802598 RepID=A0A1G1WI92_9BACT|nr:MAG: DNA primase [Candidatus Woykebacteria bacterium RBG_19FT_COMBO_43_10]
MDNQIEEIKNKLDIVGLVNEYAPLKKAGRNYKALCPFHNEKTASFMVSPDRQIFKCFGCSEGGDIFAFYKRIEGVEFGEAMKVLANRAGVRLKEFKPTRAEQQKETLFKAHELASRFYHHLLTKHPVGKKALDYLKARGVKQKSIDDFQLGFAPEKESPLVDYLKKKDFSIQDITIGGLGTVSTGKPRDWFRGRIMFPISDTSGRCVAFSGRALGNTEPKYLNSPETPVFSKSKALYGINLAKANIQKEKSAVLVEGNLDVISSFQVGVTNVVAPLGTSLTETQVEILRRWAENLLFAFDTDLAGDAAAKRAINIAENADMNIRIVQLSSGKDPDDLIRKDPLLWKKAVKSAVPIYDYYIESAVKNYGVEGAEAKRKIAAEVLPQIAAINNDIFKAHYLQLIASRLRVEEDILREALKKYQAGEKVLPSIKEILDRPLSEKGAALTEKYLLALILQSTRLPDYISEKLFEELKYREIFKILKSFYEKEGKLKIKALGKSVPEALLPEFDELLLFEVSEEILTEEAAVEKEINYCSLRLKELNLRTKLKDLSLAIKQAESVGNQPRVAALSTQFRNLSRALVSLEEV